MTKDLDKIIEICKQFSEIRDKAWTHFSSPRSAIEYCEKLKCLGLKFGDSVDFVDFEITKNTYLTNSATHYQFDNNSDQYYIVWDNGNIGQLQFVSQAHCSDVEDDWQEFRQKLLSYDPLDWDPHNCHMIFDIEHGKKLIKDYPQICEEASKKMRKKVSKLELQKAKEEYERLLEEVGDESICCNEKA